MRVIDNTNNKVLKVVKLKKVTSAVITDYIRDIVGHKYSLKDHPIDEMDLGAKMATLLKQVDDFQKTGALPTPITPQAGPKPTIKMKKPTSQPDSFWSAYSTAVTKPAEIKDQSNIQQEITTETTTTEPVISFGQNLPSHPTPTQSVETSSELDEVFSVLGVNCPNCGAEVDYDAEICPKCGTPIE